MADNALSSRVIIAPYRSPAGSARIVTFDASTCASTALIKAGNVVQFDATGSATHRLVRSSTGTLGGILSTNYVGVAAMDDTSDGSTTGLGDGKRQITVWAADPRTEFKFPAQGTLASTLVNTARALKWDSTLNVHVCDVGNSTAAVLPVIITEILNPGDSGGFLVGRFAPAAVVPAITIK